MKEPTKLRSYMREHGTKIEEVMMGSGLSYSTVRHLYYGTNNGNPGVKTAKKIMEALGCKFEDIF